MCLKSYDALWNIKSKTNMTAFLNISDPYNLTWANKPSFHIYISHRASILYIYHAYLSHITALIVTPERAHGSACVCKLSIWLTTNTVSGVQQLFSGEIWCRQRVNSSIQRLLGLVCPNAPMGKESPIH